MKTYKNIVFIFVCFLAGCATPNPPPAPFVPYKAYDYPPPHSSQTSSEPVSLRCIDSSNIYVHCNESWWWAGPERGWIPVGGGWYPWPRQVWPKNVYNLYSYYYRGTRVVPFPY